jgi:hypothetical protein
MTQILPCAVLYKVISHRTTRDASTHMSIGYSAILTWQGRQHSRAGTSELCTAGS